jgi:2-polyprenyl-6-hydroxyphenyl methylase/3-demethylubiquinone-9 3-methyltransferase
MAPLHRMNPARVGWIVERLARAHGRDPAAPDALRGLAVLDVGCGAGLASESLARRGAAVTGLDAAEETLAVARRHAAAEGLPVRYLEGGPEDLGATEAGRFDAVLALEVVEHVADRPAFLGHLARLARPGGGLVVLSTLNRTPRAFLLAKLGAEYLLRWLPVGTHDWRMFVTPAELGAELRAAGLRVTDIAGMTLDPLRGRFRITRDVAVNYLIAAVR